MSHFAFITRSEFRVSLESDYGELQVCFENGAWKSVHVLGGSIVEALLIDYLLEKPDLVTGAKTALDLDLGRAVTICKSNGILTERTADLCSVIRAYRNLIHPGRQVRLNEPAPSQGSAQIVLALLDLIIAEIAETRTASFGLTAEQFLSKLERDSKSMVLVPYLLREMHSSELERLLADVLPSRCTELYLRIDDNDPFSDDLVMLSHIGQAYHKAFESAEKTIKTSVVKRFPTILRSGDGDTVTLYLRHLFRVPYLEYISDSDRSMVKDYLISELPSMLDVYSADQASDLIDYLEPKDIEPWLDRFVRAILNPQVAEDRKSVIRSALLNAAGRYPGKETTDVIDKRFKDWTKTYQNRNQTAQAEVVRELRDDFFESLIPF